MDKGISREELEAIRFLYEAALTHDDNDVKGFIKAVGRCADKIPLLLSEIDRLTTENEAYNKAFTVLYEKIREQQEEINRLTALGKKPMFKKPVRLEFEHLGDRSGYDDTSDRIEAIRKRAEKAGHKGVVYCTERLEVQLLSCDKILNDLENSNNIARKGE